MHYYRRIPQNSHTFALFHPPKIGNLVTPVQPPISLPQFQTMDFQRLQAWPPPHVQPVAESSQDLQAASTTSFEFCVWAQIPTSNICIYIYINMKIYNSMYIQYIYIYKIYLV